jgi:TldD protein
MGQWIGMPSRQEQIKMLETMDISKILRMVMSGGGEFADIYFEKVSTSIVCEDDKIERVITGTDRVWEYA